MGRRFVRWIGKANEKLSELGCFGFSRSADEVTENFTPYQLILGTLTLVYALRHVSDIFGLGGERR